MFFHFLNLVILKSIVSINPALTAFATSSLESSKIKRVNIVLTTIMQYAAISAVINIINTTYRAVFIF